MCTWVVGGGGGGTAILSYNKHNIVSHDSIHIMVLDL